MFSDLTGVGTGANLVVTGTGQNLEIRNILGNGFVDVTTVANDVQIGLNENLTGASFIFSNTVPSGFPNGSVLTGNGVIDVSTISGNTVISFIGNTGDDVKLNSVGTGNSLVFSNVGPCLEIKSILAGSGITISDTGNTLIIAGDMEMFSDLTGVGTGANLVVTGTGQNLEIRNILGNGFVDVTTVANDVQIGLNANLTNASFIFSNTVPSGFPNGSVLTGNGVIDVSTVSGNTVISFIGNTGDDVKLNSVGTGNSLVFSNVGPCLEIKSILAGSGISISDTGNTLIISANVVDLYSNLTNAGSGSGNLVVDGFGPDLSIRGIIGNGFVDADIVGNDIQISLNSNLIDASFIFSNTVPSGFPNGSVLTAGNGIIITTVGNVTTINSNVVDLYSNLTNAGSGSGNLVVDGFGPDLSIRGIIGNGFVDTGIVGNDIQISLDGNLTGASFIFSNTVPSGFPNGSTLTAGNGIIITTVGNVTTINSNVVDLYSNLTNAGSGSGNLVVDGFGPDLSIRGIIGNGFVDTGIVGNDIQISLDGNLTGASFIFSNTVPSGFPNGSVLSAGNGIIITTVGNVTTINSNIVDLYSNLTNAGSASGNLVVDGFGPDLSIRGIIGNGFVDVGIISNDVQIGLNSNLTGASFIFSNTVPSGFPNGSTLTAGNGIIITTVGNVTTINSNVVDLYSNLTNAGSSSGNLVVDGFGPDLSIRGIIGNGFVDAGIVGNDVQISLNSNLTGASFIFSNTVPSGFPNGSVLTAGNGIIITTVGNVTTINSNIVDLYSNLTNAGSASGNLVVDGFGPDLSIRGIIGNGFVDASIISNDVQIGLNSNLTGASFIFSNTVPSGFPNGSTLTAGNGIIITTVGNVTTINSNVVDLYSNLTNAGSGSGNLVVDGFGPDLSIRGIVGNGFVNVGIISNDVEISLNSNLTNSSFIFSNTVPSGFPNGSTLTAGNGIIITTVGNVTTINSNVVDLYSNLTNAGSGSGNLVVDGFGPELSIRGIIGNGFVDASIIGNDIQISLDANLTGASFIFSNTVPSGFPNGSTLTGNGVITVNNVSGNTVISFIGNTGDDVTLTSVGTGNSLVFDSVGPDLSIKSLLAGSGITISESSNTLTISANIESIFSDLTGVGTGANLVVNGTGPDLEIRNITGNGFIDVTTVANDIQIGLNSNLTNAPFIFSNTFSSNFTNGSILTAGNGIIINTVGNVTTITANDIDIYSNLTNVGSATGNLVVNGTGPNLTIRGITSNGFVTVTQNSNNLDLGLNANLTNAPFIFSNSFSSNFTNGSILTAGNGIIINTIGNVTTVNSNISLSSVGTGNVNLVVNGTGSNLTIQSLNAGNGITLSSNANTVTVSVNPNTIQLTSYIVSNSTEVAGTATTYTTMLGMEVTPISGTYMVSFSGSAENTTQSQDEVDYAIFRDSTIVSDSERTFGYSGNNNNKEVRVSIHTQTIVTANGSEIITTKYRIDSGTFTIYNRNMILLKIG